MAYGEGYGGTILLSPMSEDGVVGDYHNNTVYLSEEGECGSEDSEIALSEESAICLRNWLISEFPVPSSDIPDVVYMQPEDHTLCSDEKWLILATRILRHLERDDVADGLEQEFDAHKHPPLQRMNALALDAIHALRNSATPKEKLYELEDRWCEIAGISGGSVFPSRSCTSSTATNTADGH